ncbi:MAG: head GIN domain-containing protein [Hyphomonadaceae bacterium]|nr:head GIN domain-containing protein [Hyphomonadaceae bacterium]
MRHSLLLIPAAAVGLVTAAVVFPAFADTKSYSLSNFDKLSVSAGIEVDVVQGPFSVKVDTPNNNFDNLVIEVRGSTLRLGRKNTSWFTRGPEYHVTVSAPSYSAFDVSSGAHVEADNLTMKDVSVDVSSGAHIELEGSCAALKLDVSSGAHFNGEDLKCQSASVDASSGAHADAFATQKASGNASSGAHISFHGKPASVSKDTSSGGSVKAL